MNIVSAEVLQPELVAARQFSLVALKDQGGRDARNTVQEPLEFRGVGNNVLVDYFQAGGTAVVTRVHMDLRNRALAAHQRSITEKSVGPCSG